MQAIVVAQQDSNMQLYNVSLINYTTLMNQQKSIGPEVKGVNLKSSKFLSIAVNR